MSYVAIVGRPNVGKSTLFNYLVGQRISIVEDSPGVTRDRIYADVEWTGKRFTLIDTGGITFGGDDTLLMQMRYQAEVAVESADLIIFMVDGRTGVTTADREVAQLLRNTKKPVLLVVNKLDVPNLFPHATDFFTLGLGDPLPISAANGLNLGDFLDAIITSLPQEEETTYGADVVKIAVMGRPNVGKSSLVNSILGENRVIVSDIPGTTRDAIDTYFERDNHKYVLIDTAGLRRKAKIREDIERYSVVRSLRAVDKANICLMVIDATEGVLEQDKKIIGYAHERGKGLIYVVNKWDLIEKDDKTADRFAKNLKAELLFADYAPVIFVSAKTGQRVQKILELVNSVREQQRKRISTSALMELILEATLVTPPPSEKGKRLKIGFVTQVSVEPPTFLLFVNDPELLHFSYKRFLENRLRAVYAFVGTPIVLAARKKE
ncbi:MAG: ribosome biogenesis GTPase Der [Firmicutes bacterium]|nr:ribosome biogenesis GTPase Der [Dethiobacter sp.]MBS3889363.1 ribosome biogenesis GTPase Der [Bacillota bacterium]MBS4055307.1 ribosome biogenesis GTPase Der [Thermaerobacter sp.]